MQSENMKVCCNFIKGSKLSAYVPGHVQKTGGCCAGGEVRALQFQKHNQMQGDVGTRLLV